MCLDKSERGEWKSGLKLNIQKTKIMASSPIISSQIDEETMETVKDFYFIGLQKSLQMVSAAMKIKDCSLLLLLGRKAMTNLDSILKSRDNTLQTKIHLVKAMVFPVVMYGCESWTKELMLLNCGVGEESWESLGPARRSNQSILKEISPEYSLEGLMLKLKL